MSHRAGYVFLKSGDPAVQAGLANNPGWNREAFNDGTWELFGITNGDLWEQVKSLQQQGSPLVRVVPALHRTLNRLPANVKNFLNSHGVTFLPGDTVGDILAKLTNNEDFGE